MLHGLLRGARTNQALAEMSTSIWLNNKNFLKPSKIRNQFTRKISIQGPILNTNKKLQSLNKKDKVMNEMIKNRNKILI